MVVLSKLLLLRLTLEKWYVFPTFCWYMQLIDRKIQIVVHAPAAATDHLLESCAGIRAMTKDIYAPAQGECIQIGQHTNSFSVSLSDELLASLKMSRVRLSDIKSTPLRLNFYKHSSKITRLAMSQVESRQ